MLLIGSFGSSCSTKKCFTPARFAAAIRRGHSVVPDPTSSIAFPMRFMQNYTGEMDRELTFGPDPVGALAYLATLDEVQFSGDFLDFDTDCQSGAVTGTLGAKDGGPVFAAASLAAPGEGRYPPPGINDKNRVP